jgi:hypothetical protein
MSEPFKALCLHATDPSLCKICNSLYGLKKHIHKCLGCGWVVNPLGHIDPDCSIPLTVEACIMCREEHVWLTDLRAYANMLIGKIRIPHTIGSCFICGKARLRQLEYKELVNEEISR